MPSPSAPPIRICSTDDTSSVSEGTRMSPVPRSTEASVFSSQISTAPKNSTPA